MKQFPVFAWLRCHELELRELEFLLAGEFHVADEIHLADEFQFRVADESLSFQIASQLQL